MRLVTIVIGKQGGWALPFAVALILGASLSVAGLRVALEVTGHDGDVLLTSLFTSLVPASVTALAILVASLHRE